MMLDYSSRDSQREIHAMMAENRRNQNGKCCIFYLMCCIS